MAKTIHAELELDVAKALKERRIAKAETYSEIIRRLLKATQLKSK